jgi:hypothetical protein
MKRLSQERRGIPFGAVAADAKALDALCAPELSYSHSSGKVEDKPTFIANSTDGKSKYLSLEYQDTTIRVVGPAAIVRFHWVAEQRPQPTARKPPPISTS